MHKIILGLVLLFLSGCVTHDRLVLHEKPSYEIESKLNGKLSEYSIAEFGIDLKYKLNRENLIRVGSYKLGSSRYMAASVIFGRGEHDRRLFNQEGAWGRAFYAYSSISESDAEKKSMELCNLFQSSNKFWGKPSLKCEFIITYDFIKHKQPTVASSQKIESRNQENEYERYLKQCEQIGFKRNTEKIGECALKIKDIEAKIQISNSQRVAPQSSQQQNTQITQSQNSSADTLANLVILNEAIKLMNPPKRNFNCQARPFGIYTNVYCN
jgi:hypothetical protein